MGCANVWPGSWALGAWGAVGSHAGCSVIVKGSGKHWRELRSWEENTEAESRSSFPDPSFGVITPDFYGARDGSQGLTCQARTLPTEPRPHSGARGWGPPTSHWHKVSRAVGLVGVERADGGEDDQDEGQQKDLPDMGRGHPILPPPL